MTIYQLFCGRQAEANILDHPGQVLKRLQSWSWSNLKNSGFTTIYLLGVIDHRGPISVTEEQNIELKLIPNRTPSIFAINDHRQIDPTLGTIADLSELIETLHRADLQVLVDFIPNQTSLGHIWVGDHPEYYLRNSDGYPQKAFSQDVLLLDQTNQAVKQDLKNTLAWLEALGVDGVRCDMAHLTQPDLWPELIKHTKAINDQFTFLAEAYSESVFDWSPLRRLLDSGFTAIYHEFLYRNLGWSLGIPLELNKLSGHLNYVLKSGLAQQLVHYVSNHDDPPFDVLKGLNEALISLLLFLPGHTLIYNGSLNGFERRLAHHWVDVLPSGKSELSSIPQWFNNAVWVSKALKVSLSEVKVINGKVIEGKLQSNGQSYRLWSNLADTPQQISFDQQIAGLLHGLSGGDQLEAYQAEVWPETFSK